MNDTASQGGVNGRSQRCKAIANASRRQNAAVVGAKSLARRTALGTASTTGFDADAWIPKTQSAFRVNQLAEFLEVSSQHLYNLIIAGELKVPAENIERASSRAAIMVPRASIVAFVRHRASSAYLKRKAAADRTPPQASFCQHGGRTKIDLAAGLPQQRQRLTVKETAEYLCCNEDHVYHLVQSGELTADNRPLNTAGGKWKRGGPPMRILRASIIALRARRRIKQK